MGKNRNGNAPYWATEVAYKNGYAKGYADGKAETVEVVRCCDCKHWDKMGICDLHTEVNAVWMDADDFCSKGEKRGADNG